MKINSITIHNFQSYYGTQTIEFGDGLNLIIGNGGKGKSKLFNAFAPRDLRNAFNLKSGDLSSSFNIKGKMKEAVANANLKLQNFDFGDRKNTFDIKNGELNSAFKYDSKIESNFFFII